ncbi:MAG: ROK family protein [Candidatus Limnocylindrales bacterium]
MTAPRLPASAVEIADRLVAPRVVPVLDPEFRPGALAARRLALELERSGEGREVWLALEQPAGSTSHHRGLVAPEDHPACAASYALCERFLKLLLWSRGGCRVAIDGPPAFVEALGRHYRENAAGRFDARMMGAEIYGQPFEIVPLPRAQFRPAHEPATVLGGHRDGSRIGFDLGASDRKVAAVLDGEVVFSEEVRWDPVGRTDPQWHFDQIDAGLRRAAAHLPRIDAIGGSAAGVYVNGEVRVASLFRSVPRPLFETRVRGIFGELAHAWGDVPFVIVNDGEVAALAGATQAGVGALLGMALGSSLAAGYVTGDGTLTSWLNELAFAPLDLAPEAPLDDWSLDRGCGAQYLSQQAVARLLPKAGIEVGSEMPLPERLLELQRLMAAQDPRAVAVYRTVGTYLGYALLEYAAVYEIEHVLALGRVMSGAGGDMVVEGARAVLAAEAPDRAGAIAFHVASERDKRHGQAVAAAGLPALR